MSLVGDDATVIGIDEVGRGAWAGPVTVGAVELEVGSMLPGVRDSKQLTPAARTAASRVIRRHAARTGLGWVSAAELDAQGLSWALHQAALRALAQLGTSNSLVIVDGKHNFLAATHRSVAIVSADALVPPVAAASVLAKVARDNYMNRLELKHPGYGFAAHKGYGTLAHRRAIGRLGPSDQHRQTWGPFRSTQS